MKKISDIDKREDWEIEEAVRLIRTFLAYPVGKFISITAYACTYRYKAFIDSICGKKDESAFQMANELYYDIGNIDGIVSTQLDCLLSHYYKKDSLDWETASKDDLWHTLKNLCIATGSYRYENKMNRMEAIFFNNMV